MCGHSTSTSRSDHVWALDFQFDVTDTGKTLKLLHVVDQHTQESLADLVADSIDADGTVAAVDKIVGGAKHAPQVHPMRRRARAHRQRSQGIVPLHRRWHQRHRSRLTVAEQTGAGSV